MRATGVDMAVDGGEEGASDARTADEDAREGSLETIATLCRAARDAKAGESGRAVDALRRVLTLSKEALPRETLLDARFAACGKIVNQLRKRHEAEGVRDAAAAVKARWTAMIVEQTSGKSEKTKEVKREVETAAKERGGGEEEDAALVEARADVKKRLTRVNDAARDRTREIFADALALCVTDGKIESVDAKKLASIVDQIENSMTAKWPSGGKDYKAKVRQLAFNLKDAKNPDLRTNLATGEISAGVLIDLSPEELGSNERRNANERIRELAEWEAVRGQQQEASTDAFKCGKCKQRKCTYYQLQTRSADEPMTTFVTCVECGNRWKFC